MALPENDMSWSLNDTGILYPVTRQRSSICYAIVVAETISAKYAKENGGEPVVLAVQQMIDHVPIQFKYTKTKKPDKKGCYLAKFSHCYMHIKEHGLCLADDYKYQQGYRHTNIPPIPLKKKFRISGFEKLDNKPIEYVNNILHSVPIAGCMEVYDELIDFKGEEIYHGPKIPTESIGKHAILVIGYGVEKGVHYLWVKNSWRKTWGVNGIAKVRRDLVKFLMCPLEITYDGAVNEKP